jgi:hypothetical protein
MSNNGNGSFWTSWSVIVLAFIFFWPLGVILLIKKFTTDKKSAFASAGRGIMTTFGFILAAFGTIGFFATLSDPNGVGFAMAFFFIAGGVALIIKSKKLKKETESTKQYLSIIVNGNIRQLDTISATIGKSYDVVYKDVKNMIAKGYLKNAYIDEIMREVVLPNAAPVTPQNTSTAAPANVAPVQTKIITCPCCGANNTIVGDTGECEYCGSPLK